MDCFREYETLKALKGVKQFVKLVDIEIFKMPIASEKYVFRLCFCFFCTEGKKENPHFLVRREHIFALQPSQLGKGSLKDSRPLPLRK